MSSPGLLPKRSEPRIIPVLDILNGQVVRAVAGRRHEYQPIQSNLAPGSEPETLACKLLEITGTRELYVADLDAILGRVPVSQGVLDFVEKVPATCWVDVGLRDVRTARHLLQLPNAIPIWASETITPALLQEYRSQTDRGDPAPFGIFSIDLKDGRLLGDWRAWGARDDRDMLSIASQAVAHSFKTLIMLDLGRVGVHSGPGTLELCSQLRQEFPGIEIVAGGGVRGWTDVVALGAVGVNAVLIASALHDGRLISSP